MSIFNGLVDFVARSLAFFYALPGIGGSYGLAIIMLTMAVMVLLMPLTLKATRSTIKMQQVQPELKRLQKEHKNDRETMNAELMKLYSENGINPIGGCLPIVAQLPVFLVLFRILRGLTRRVEDVSFFDAANQIRQLRGGSAQDGQRFAPEYLKVDSQMYEDLAADTEMKFGPFDLAERALDVLQSDFLAAIPYVLLIVFVVGSSYYQQRQVSARRPTPGAESNEAPSQMMQQQQLLLKVLPLMSGIWSFLFPAGLVLYWATSNLFRIGQQSYITHQIYGKEAPTVAEADAVDPVIDPETATEFDTESPEPSSVTNAEKASPGDASEAVETSGTKLSGAKKPSRPDKAAARNAQWQELREERAAKQKKNQKQQASEASDQSSGRVTPKGTKSNPSRKKKR